MRRLMVVLGLMAWSGSVLADEPARGTPVAATIERGLAFLAKDALLWKSEHNCVTCHHAGLVVWAMREAQTRGYAVNEPVLNELTTWIAESGNGKTSLPRPDGIPQALNEKAVSLALALGANPQPDAASQAGLKRLLQTVKEDQLENGGWASWPETRPPIFGNSDERATVFAALALLPAAAAGDSTAQAARDKAVQWLVGTKSDDELQSLAMRVVLWQRVGRPAEEIVPLVRLLRERQNADGGWSQTPQMASDAWASGQALYALAHAGVAPDDMAIRRGDAFLVKSQGDDGSWPMTSRPTRPGGEGSKSLIPIIGAGSAWAVLGLVRNH